MADREYVRGRSGFRRVARAVVVAVHNYMQRRDAWRRRLRADARLPGAGGCPGGYFETRGSLPLPAYLRMHADDG